MSIVKFIYQSLYYFVNFVYENLLINLFHQVKTIIIADNREKSSGIPDLLTDKNIEVQMAQLSMGDYMLNSDIIIERKSKEDFIQSIIDGRLFTQSAGLRNTGMAPLIIVEGNPYQTRHDIHPEAIKGTLLSIALSWQIPVIRSSGKEDTARLIIMAAEQVSQSPVFVHRNTNKPKKKQNQQHYFVQGIPGVGPVLTHNLLAHFSTIEQIILANIKALSEVEGIGKTKADKLFKFFRTGNR